VAGAAAWTEKIKAQDAAPAEPEAEADEALPPSDHRVEAANSAPTPDKDGIEGSGETSPGPQSIWALISFAAGPSPGSSLWGWRVTLDLGRHEDGDPCPDETVAGRAVAVASAPACMFRAIQTKLRRCWPE